MTTLAPLLDLLTPFLPGMVELPEAYGERLYALSKSASHRYVKRIPSGKVTKTGKIRYRYFYHVGHGGTVANSDHFVEGAAFQHDGGHFHIKGVDGDKLTIEHDETGEKKSVTKAQLRGMLTERHGKELDAHREKAHADLADAKKAGASAKQIARLEARAKAAGPAAKAEPKTVAEHKAAMNEEAAKFQDAFRGALRSAVDKAPSSQARAVSSVMQAAVSQVVSGGAVDFKVLARDYKFKNNPNIMSAMNSAFDAIRPSIESYVAASNRYYDSIDSEVPSKVGTLKEPGTFSPKPKKLGVDKAKSRTAKFVSDDPSRPSLGEVRTSGGKAYATDGHRIAVIPTIGPDSGPTDLLPRMRSMVEERATEYGHMDAESLVKTLTAILDAKKARGDNTKRSESPTVQITAEGIQDIKPSSLGRGTGSSVQVPSTGRFKPVKANIHYLLDALKGAKGTVRIGTTDQYNPVHIEREDGEHHIIMPMRS